jgi:hypothetical protein
MELGGSKKNMSLTSVKDLFLSVEALGTVLFALLFKITALF